MCVALTRGAPGLVMKAFIHLGSVALVLSATSMAFAEDASSTSSSVVGTAPSRAFELGVSAGFTQGFGDVSRTTRLSELARDGAAIQLDLGYRVSPRFLIGVYGEAAGYQRGDWDSEHTDTAGAAAGVQAQLHYAPFQKVDPWLGVGFGWRGLWQTKDDSVRRSLQGFDALRVQAGIDYRLSRQISISPVLGLSVSRFVAEKKAERDDFTEIKSPRDNVFLFFGAMGRFDFGGVATRNVNQVASRD